MDEVISRLEKLNVIDQKLDGIYSQIDNLGSRIVIEHQKTNLLIKLQGIISYLNIMDRDENELRMLLLNNADNRQMLIQRLRSFIESYAKANNEYIILHQIFKEYHLYSDISSDVLKSKYSFINFIFNIIRVKSIVQS